MVKKSNMKRKSNVVEKDEDEESEHFDFVGIGVLVIIVLLCILELVLAGKASIHMYKLTGSILESTAMFILGIMADLVIITLFLMLGGLYDQLDCTMYPLMGFLIIEIILVLISLV